MISENVVKTDQRLERAAAGASEDLAAHRWHWTLDESNAKRVPLREYARAVGRGETPIRGMVNGYVMFTAPGNERSLSECIERAKMGTEKAAVTGAIAKARGEQFGTTRQKRSNEIRRTRAIAQDRAEKRGTTVEEEAEKVAEMAAKLDRVNAKQVDRRRGQHSLRFLSVENELSVVVRRLGKVLSDTEGVEFSADERELIGDAIGKVKAVLGLIDLRLTGGADVDWDAELANLEG